MDRKSIIILVACFLLLFSWPLLVNKVFPPKPLPPGATNATPRSLVGTNETGTPTGPAPVLERPPMTRLAKFHTDDHRRQAPLPVEIGHV